MWASALLCSFAMHSRFPMRIMGLRLRKGGWLLALLFWVTLSLGAEERYLGVPKPAIEQVIELGYNLDARTPELIEAMIEGYPESPMGLCLKAARLFRLDGYAEGSDDVLTEAFETVSEAAIDAAKVYFEAHPSDPTADYAVAMCELNLARYYIEHGRWFGGFFKARSGLGRLNGILKEYPDFHDAKLPLGVANCFLDKVPAYLKPFALLLSFSGDMELGLQQLRDAETMGFLTRHESLYYQIGVQWELLDDREAAGRILDRFLDRFPGNVDAHVMRSHLHRQLENYESALVGYDGALAMPEVSYLKEARDWVVFQSGYTALHLDDSEEALKRANQVLNTIPEERRKLGAWARVLKGNALIHLKRFGEARELLEAVRKSDSSDAYKGAKDALTQLDRIEQES